jgi:hypothetical protein
MGMGTRRSIPRSVRAAVLLLAGAVVGLSTPAVARTVVDYAKHAGYANRAGFAKNAERVDHFLAGAFITSCGAGSIIGEAYVPADVGSDWTQVSGYAFHHGPGPDLRGAGCPHSTPVARHVSTGVYDVNLTLGMCSGGNGVGVVVTPVTGAVPVVATYLACSSPSSAIEVHLTDLGGAPVDSSFTVAQLDSPAIIP